MKINGNQVLYRYLQGQLLESDVWLFQMLTARLVLALGIWFHPDIYAQFPFLRRFAVRDPHARGNARLGIPDQWGSPDSKGLFRDDNSLIKGMPKALEIQAPLNHHYNGRTIGQGFVASHVWRTLVPSETLGARHPLTYSFVPNLVWLPSEVSKLTDREGSFVQQYVQAISWKIYRNEPVVEKMQALVAAAWDLLPEPIAIPERGTPKHGLNERSYDPHHTL